MENLSNRAAMTVQEFIDWAQISRTTFYKQRDKGLLKVRKVGRKCLISTDEAQRWFDGLPEGDQ